MKQTDNRAGIYIHIPFCVRKCDYCDFLSAPAAADEQLRYMEALREEIRIVSNSEKAKKTRAPARSLMPGGDGDGENGSEEERTVDTVFFGGGTPSILPAEEITKTLDVVRACFAVTGDAEITVECNPGTLTEEKCESYLAAGVNRLSIGLQSADKRLLKEIGRIHTPEDFFKSYEAARRAGFKNINIDLMSGLPGQSVEDHVDTLRKVISLHPEHLSAYSLILEEGTPLYERIMHPKKAESDAARPVADRESEGTLTLPTEDEEMEMYVKTREILESCGYHRYEISNYCLPGKECRHNLRYWNLLDYYGFGIGAASFAEGCRYKNTDDRENYVKLLSPKPPAEQETADSRGDFAEESLKTEKIRTEFTRETDRELMEEFVFLGLRKTEGIRRGEFLDRFGRAFDEVYGPVKKKLIRQGLLRETSEDDRISLTNRGIDMSNEVLAEFLL